VENELMQQSPASPIPAIEPPRKIRKHKVAKTRKISKKRQRGFSLIEVMVVLVIIAIISAIALPRLLQARTSSIEGAAASTTRSIGTALMGYQTRFNVWPTALTVLGGTSCDTTAPALTASCGLDNTIATAVGTGYSQYVWSYAPVAGGSFTLNGDPLATSSAKRHYFMDGGLTIHYNDSAAAASTDPVLGN